MSFEYPYHDTQDTPVIHQQITEAVSPAIKAASRTQGHDEIEATRKNNHDLQQRLEALEKENQQIKSGVWYRISNLFNH